MTWLQKIAIRPDLSNNSQGLGGNSGVNPTTEDSQALMFAEPKGRKRKNVHQKIKRDFSKRQGEQPTGNM